jgi:hypothetical protein
MLTEEGPLKPGNMGFIFLDRLSGDPEMIRNCIAHEIGHVLALAKRNGYEPFSGMVRTSRESHDEGAWPEDNWYSDAIIDSNNVTVGLMYWALTEGQKRWLRHEDWNTSNAKAAAYLAP